MTELIEPDEAQRGAIRSLYGPSYADRYEVTWQRSDIWRAEAEHHVRTLRSLVDEAAGRWLDVGCGTGYNLSQFPGVERAGLDLSPSMLEKARAANPDALFFREGDMAVDIPEWHDAWDLVTCTGQPWSYLTSMDEIERSVAIMAGWTAPGGVCMLQPGDLADLNGCELDYDFSGDPPPPGTTRITGAIWSHWEVDLVHVNMIWPSLDVWVGWFADHFHEVEVFHWPHDPPKPILHVPRRVIVARRKRRPGEDGRATIVVRPPEPEAVPDAEPVLDADAGPETDVVPDREPVPGPEVAPDPAPAGPPPERPVGELPSALLLRELGRRVAPWDPRFRRGAARRVDELRSRLRSR